MKRSVLPGFLVQYGPAGEVPVDKVVGVMKYLLVSGNSEMLRDTIAGMRIGDLEQVVGEIQDKWMWENDSIENKQLLEFLEQRLESKRKLRKALEDARLEDNLNNFVTFMENNDV